MSKSKLGHLCQDPCAYSQYDIFGINEIKEWINMNCDKDMVEPTDILIYLEASVCTRFLLQTCTLPMAAGRLNLVYALSINLFRAKTHQTLWYLCQVVVTSTYFVSIWSRLILHLITKIDLIQDKAIQQQNVCQKCVCKPGVSHYKSPS